ncbi:hypothetical protein B9Z47_05720 [Limnohabitans sp. 2KL-1]|uniref:Ig-like domain-containing protein n=1 Tax=Limnohabitans sp. 2KL-1 TaxID=1100699 RepID=UPI000D3AED9E|nr:Ig-like domain-containing protein [Limnohabitans sp. 2KL-1]PUE49011.1 hypothetical protein B9Z47_05720 [Limnohabitans sp. 2KL-1]
MSKAYKIKLNQGQGETKFLDIPQSGALGTPLAVKAVAGGKYQLMDGSTGYAPENIRTSRLGKNLLVFFEGRSTADLVIEDYYDVTPEGFNGLIGESESGRFYEYIPETAVGYTSVPLLADGSGQVGMALGGAEITASGAAVGTLVAAAGLNPLLLAPLGLLGAAAGGGGGGGGDAGTGGGGTGGGTDTTAPEIKSAQLHTDDDSGPKDNITADTTPRIQVQTEPNADVSVELDGKTYTGKANENGVFVVQVPDANPLKDGAYTPKVTATDAAGNKAQFDGTPFTVDTSGEKNPPELDPNANALIDIISITEDSGVNKTDFYTKDNQLVFNGTVKQFTQNGDWVKLELKDASDKLIDTTYVKPVASGTTWSWSWDRTAKDKLVDGQYKLTAVVVDGADNVVGVGTSKVSDVQAVIIDTDSGNNFVPAKQEDPNKSCTVEIISMNQDTGASGSDFVTQDRTHVYLGKLNAFVDDKNGTLVEVSLKDAAGKVLASDYVIPKLVDGQWTWTWDQTANILKDGEYTLSASVVDKAGNVIHKDDPQLVVIDNSTADNGAQADANTALKMLPVSFSDDTGLKADDYLTKDQSLSVKGAFDKDFIDNGDRVLVQIFGQDGKLMNQQYVKPEGPNWTFQNDMDLGQKDETKTYTVKSSLVDAAGNTLQATSQSFVVDLFTSVITPKPEQGSNGVNTFKIIDFSSSERGSYTFATGTGASMTKSYDGGVFQMKEIEGKVFAAGQFSLEFTDWAGNVKTVKNPGEVWDFSQAVMSNPVPSVLPVPGFNADQLVGSVGKLVLPTGQKEFDMASLYDGISSIGETVAVNHVDMAQGIHTLELTMGDVLQLGVKNSFSTSTTHKGKLQMRIEGDAADKLVLDDLVGEKDYDWVNNNSVVSLDGQNYNAYTHESLGLSLFVHTSVSIQMV